MQYANLGCLVGPLYLMPLHLRAIMCLAHDSYTMESAAEGRSERADAAFRGAGDQRIKDHHEELKRRLSQKTEDKK